MSGLQLWATGVQSHRGSEEYVEGTLELSTFYVLRDEKAGAFTYEILLSLV